MMKHLLVIAPNCFPPLFSSGSVRNVKFIKFLHRLGWRCTVFTTDQGSVDDADPSLTADLPDGTGVIRVPVPLFGVKAALNSAVGSGGRQNKPGHIRGFVRLVKRIIFGIIRFLVLMPDDHILWTWRICRRIRRSGSDAGYSAILSSGPPFSAHLAGWYAARRLGVPWTADFRDLWAGHTVFGARSLYRRWMEYRQEARVFRDAAVVTAATAPISSHYKEKYRYAQKKVHTVANGFDPDDYPAEPVSCLLDARYCNIVYTGSLGNLQTPRYFLEAVRNLLADKPEYRQILRVTFAGICAGSSGGYFDDPDLRDVVRHIGLIAHRDAVSLMCGADILLHIIYPEPGGETIMCGKFYEYLGARRTILGLVPPGIAMQTIRNGNLGVCAAPDDTAGQQALLERLVSQWKEGSLFRLPEPTREYTREFQTGILAAQIMTGGGR